MNKPRLVLVDTDEMDHNTRDGLALITFVSYLIDNPRIQGPEFMSSYGNLARQCNEIYHKLHPDFRTICDILAKKFIDDVILRLHAKGLSNEGIALIKAALKSLNKTEWDWAFDFRR